MTAEAEYTPVLANMASPGGEDDDFVEGDWEDEDDEDFDDLAEVGEDLHGIDFDDEDELDPEDDDHLPDDDY